MQVKVLYFASVREKLGLNAEDLELPVSVATVADLRAHLRARGGVWSDALADTKLLRTAVNQDLAPATTAIKAGDEVAFFPPVTGG
ncbi:MAG: molybdopterin converting factor subunit 1 [Betaproteobacteria bacterium]|nr:molybdopterin converting factor subunit 1 [Betaproteobacteria bacterium]MSQ88458.1 molybdopterin converting factor subunit 1 [Betaproteobacteria bacterium]